MEKDPRDSLPSERHGGERECARGGAHGLHPPYLKIKGAKAARLRRHTNHVWPPGVSIFVKGTCRVCSQSQNFRLAAVRKSSVPQAIHSRRSGGFGLAARPGKAAWGAAGTPRPEEPT